jgi:tetratricopeptide (TPR) repeat protein
MNRILCILLLAIVPAAFTVATASATVQVADERIEALVLEGKELLARGLPNEAREVFVRAHMDSGGAFSTYVWVLRALMETGSLNDTMDLIDALPQEDRESAGGNYLYGMASFLRGKGHLASGNQDGSIRFAFEDAMTFLKRATELAPETYHDGFLALAESAWYSRDLATARIAATKAVELAPASALAHYTLGRILFSHYSTALEQANPAEEAEGLLRETVAQFRSALLALGRPATPADGRLAARIHNQLGLCHVWKEERESAAEAFAEAMAWEPSEVSFSDLNNWLSTPESNAAFLTALNVGAEKFAQRHGADALGDATLLWWLGYANFAAGEYAAAEAAFKQAVKKWPQFLNAWYYIGLARYHQQDYAGCIAALRMNWEAEPANLVTSINSNRESNLEILDWIVSWCSTEERYVDASLVCEMRVGTFAENWKYWDNLGFFSRYAGAAVAASEDAELRDTAAVYYERALVAYETARALAPDKPHLLNDGAVLLHYYLHRDLERAKTMYEAALAEATALLAAAAGISDEDRQLAETAQSDARKNLENLAAGISDPY